MNALKPIAIFMILLVVAFPFYSVQVLASINIANVETYGQEGVTGYRRESDTSTFKVLAGGESVDSNYIFLESFSGGFKDKFDSCTQETFGYNCYKHLSLDTLFGGVYTYYIRSYDNEEGQGSAVNTLTAQIVVDSMAPLVNSFTSSDGSVSKSQEVELSFQVSDFAAIDCSGISRVELTVNSEENIVDIMPLNTRDCTFLGSFNIVPGSYVSQDEDGVVFYLIAYDYFETPSVAKYLQIDVDVDAPKINVDSFEVVSRVGEKPITYVSPGQNNLVKLRFLVDGDLSLVNADLSELSSDYLGILPASCQQTGYEKYICSWDVSIDFSETKTVKITSRAYDPAGNFDENIFTHTFKVDRESPNFNSLTTGYEVDGVLYLGDKTTYKAMIMESGVGLNDELVYLDLSEVSGEDKRKADNCTGSGGTWTCYWYDVDSLMSGGYKQIKLMGEDDNGNQFGKARIDVFIDKTLPQYLDSWYESSSGYCPTSSDLITIFVNVTDAGDGLGLIVDATGISTGPDNVEGECEIVDENEDIWLCSAEIGTLTSSYFNGNVPIIITDSAGNSIDQSVDVEICLLDDVTLDPNFFSVGNIVSMPAKISRKALSNTDLPLFLDIRLHGGSQPLIIEVNNCSSEIKSSESLNDFTFNPLLSVELAKNDFEEEIEAFPLRCQLRIKVRDGNTIYLNPEIEDIELDIPMYDLALGSIGENVQELIDGIDSDIGKEDDIIQKTKRQNDNLGSVCSIVGFINNVDSLLQSVKLVVTVAAIALSWLGILETVNTKVCEGTNAFHKFVDKWIWPVGTGFPIRGPGVFFKYACMYQSCKLCDFSTYSNAVVNLGALTVNKIGAKIKGEGTGSVDQQAEDEPVAAESESAAESVEQPMTEEEATIQALEALSVELGKAADSAKKNSLLTDRMLGKSGDPNSRSTGYSTEERLTSSLTAPGYGEGDFIYSLFYEGPSYAEYLESQNDFVDFNPDDDNDIGASVVADITGLAEGGGDDVVVLGKWSQNTEIYNTISSHISQQWAYNPYKSKAYADFCFCVPAKEYNARKEKQLLCMKKKCYLDSVEKGYDISSCDVLYKERNCLYVESAEYKLIGATVGGFSKRIIQMLWQNTPTIIMGIVYSVTCGKSKEGCVTSWSSIWPAVCDIYGVYVSFKDYQEFSIDTLWTDYSGDLITDTNQFTDHCEGILDE